MVVQIEFLELFLFFNFKGRENEIWVLRRSVPIKTLSFPTYLQNLEAMACCASELNTAFCLVTRVKQ